MEKLKCLECGKQCANLKGLSYHVRKHGMKYPDYLVKHVHGGAWPTCACGCGTQVKFFSGGFCASVGGHWLRGVPKSDETKRKLSKILKGRPATPERKARQSQAMINYHATNDKLKKLNSARMTGRTVSQETRDKIRKTRSARIVSGEITINADKISATVTANYMNGTNGWSTGVYTSSKCTKKCSYRSTWEVEFMKKLDVDDEVVSWVYEPFIIKYDFNGREKRYVPDFLVNLKEKTLLVEVKPYELRNRPMNVAKRHAALTLCKTNGYEYVEWDARDK